MSVFWLAPFFTILRTNGISVTIDDYERVSLVLSTAGEWNLEKFKSVLRSVVVYDPTHLIVFERCFNDFFDGKLPEPLKTSGGLPGWLDNLDEETPPPSSPPSTDIPPKTFWQGLRERSLKLWAIGWRKFSAWAIVTAVLLVTIIGVVWWYLWIEVPQVGEVPPPPATTDTTTVVFVETEPTPLPDKITAEIQPPVLKPLDEHTWSDYAGAGGLMALPFVAWLLLALLLTNLKKDEPPKYDGQKPRLFPLEQIGGEPAPRLDPDTLDHLADSLTYFLSEIPGKRLDVKATVNAVGQHGGLPVLYFQKLKRVRSIYVLEDAASEALTWNPVPTELTEGLKKRGINIEHGRFYGEPTKFQMQDGGLEWLEDLEAESNRSILLFFSDGKRLNVRRNAFLLESLARSSAVAWLDLREKRFWNESAEAIKDHKIPLYQANAQGLIRAVERFTTERGLEKDDSADVRHWDGVPPNTSPNLSGYVEAVLGGALAWAQACAMIQPVTNGMADLLRRRFQPHLPPDCIERLYRLSGTSWNVSGLRFSLPVLAVLRTGFAIRWSEDEQEEILEFILDEIRKVEPAETDSLRHMAWEWSLERVRLELDPDQALDHLAPLRRTPLGKNIKAEFAPLSIPGEEPREDSVPLRVRPVTQRGLKQFEELSGQSVKMNGLKEMLMAFRYGIREMLALTARVVASTIRSAIAVARDIARIKDAPGEVIVAAPVELSFGWLRAGEPRSDKSTTTAKGYKADGKEFEFIAEEAPVEAKPIPVVRKILGAIAGYIVFAICIFLLLSALYLAMGPDRAFLPAKYDPTMLWTISAFVLGFIAAVIGGFVAALIGRSGAVKIMAGLVLLIGAIVVVMLIKENKPDEVRTGDVPNAEAMMKAREPLWVGVVNPILGAIGVFVGGSLWFKIHSKAGKKRTTPSAETEPIPVGGKSASIEDQSGFIAQEAAPIEDE